MEITFQGGNSIIMTNKNGAILFDNNQKALGLNPVKAKRLDAVFQTMDKQAELVDGALFFDGPGEYEVKGFSVVGIEARAHIDADGAQSATMYRVDTEQVSILVAGHIYHSLSEEELEKIGMIDILIVPVGGNGFTLDATGAVSVVKKIEPKIILPTHYQDEAVSYEVPQAKLDEFVREMGGSVETLDKLKTKNLSFSEAMKVIKLERQ